MDWTGTSEQKNKTVELAVIKVEATVSVTDANYGGAVVLNPGGPGGSGIGQILRGGHHVRTLLSAGPDTEPDKARVCECSRPMQLKEKFREDVDCG